MPGMSYIFLGDGDILKVRYFQVYAPVEIVINVYRLILRFLVYVMTVSSDGALGLNIRVLLCNFSKTMTTERKRYAVFTDTSSLPRDEFQSMPITTHTINEEFRHEISWC